MWKQFRRKIRAKLLLLIFHLLAYCPLKILYALSAFLGFFFFYFPNSVRKIAEKNIAHCFPELSQMEQKAMLRLTIRHNIASILEMAFVWLRPYKALNNTIGTIEGEEDFKAILKEKNGAILITPHLGSWEMGGLYASSQYPMVTMFRPSKLGVDELMIRGRESYGAETITADALGVRRLMKALSNNKILGILPDQDPSQGEGIFVDFFGKPAKTLVLVSRLAIKFKLPVYMLTTVRDFSSCRFNLKYEALNDEFYDQELSASVAAMNRCIEKAIRRNPEQYLWAYKRFKSTENNAMSIYSKT